MFKSVVYLHHLSFETPTLGGVLSDDGDTFSAFEMQKGVKTQNRKSNIRHMYNMIMGVDIMDECFIFSKGIVIFFFLLSCYLLYDKFNLMVIFSIGCVFNTLVNIIIKLLIQSPRPIESTRMFALELMHNNRCGNSKIGYDRYGMPSGHAQYFLYMTVFIHFAVRNINITIFYLTVSLFVCIQRVVYNHHTMFQVIIGAIIGSIIGKLVYDYGNTQIIHLKY